ncbi:glycoside hydrolase family 108 protein [Lutibaculum baratangense]|uniref:Secretion activator protein n=1 Tax=Lutibaculum baratangense AMV1 TaxID=631454 RepID=V4R9D0_9HYPH|nr:glycosyl hydrolase 108 family protein [Lutibaculum baratangense]ESR22806.1 Secretion activator protein [Lutibaculum baratangense AMV1]
MAASNWPQCFGATLRHEGGYVDHPADPGGATNLGITIRTLSAWLGRPATKAEVKALTPEAVRPIYRRTYWDAVRGDDLPAGVDLVTYDAAVNSGPARGAKWTQAACGARGDGIIGPLTLGALRAADAATVIRKATDRRLAFLQGLKTWHVFGRGWGRRVGEIRAEALLMAGASPAKVQADAAGVEGAARADAGRAAAAGTAGGGGAVAGEQIAGTDWAAMAGLGIATLLLVALCVLFALRSRGRRQAAAAMRSLVTYREEV